MFPRLITLLAPNPVVFLLIAIGGITEVLLLHSSHQNVLNLSASTRIYSLGFLVWYWLTIGWLLWFTARSYNSLSNSSIGWIGAGFKGLAILLAASAIAMYIISWGLYIQTGYFANLETVRIALVNPRMLWIYLAEAQQSDFRALIVVLVAGYLGLPYLFRLIAPKTQTKAGEVWTSSQRRIAWSVCSILIVVSLILADAYDAGNQQKIARNHCLSRRLNPLVTFAVGIGDWLFREPIRPCIDPNTLISIDEAAWRFPDENSARPSVIFVAIESLRHDVIFEKHQGREVMPNLNRLAERGLHLANAYAQSTHSDYSDVCVVSSLYPLRTRYHHYYRPDDPWPKTHLYSLLKPLGYSTAIISSQNEAWGLMHNFLESPSLDLFYDARTSNEETYVAESDVGFSNEVKSGGLIAGKLWDAKTMEVAMHWITERSEAQEPFFLSVNLQSSHFPYLIPESCDRPFQPCEIDSNASFVYYPQEQTPVVRNAYYNALYECDRQIGRLVAALNKLDSLDDTILVVYGENGEAFHENGCVTHAGPPIEPVVHVACVIHAPDHLQPAIEDYPVELIDLAPTVLGLLKADNHPNFQGIDVLQPNRPPVEERFLFFHTESALSGADALLFVGRWKYSHDRRIGRSQLFDLKQDPNESVNLVNENPHLAKKLDATLKTWRERQLAYYHFPFYYEKYYPPRPPGNE